MPPPNMLSPILSQAYSNEVSFPYLKHRAAFELVVRCDLLTVHTAPALFDEAASLIPALCQLRLDEDVDHVACIGQVLLLDRDWQLVLSELAVEIGLGACSCLLSMKALHQLPRQRCFRVARFHLEHGGLLLRIQTRDQPNVFLDYRVGNGHRLAVDLLGWLADPDVVAERLAHLLHAVGSLQEREHRDVLRLLPVPLLNLPPEYQVHQLALPPHLTSSPSTHPPLPL